MGRGMIVALFAIVISLGPFAVSAAAASERWSRTISDPAASPSWTISIAGETPRDDAATDVKITRDGAVYVAGSADFHTPVSNAMTLAKIVDGSLVWVKRYEGVYGQGYSGYITSKMALGPGGVVYTVGTERLIDLGDLENDGMLVVVKWSSSGSVKWRRRVMQTGVATAVGVDDRGNVTVAGRVVGRTHEWVVASWSPSGVRRWTWRYSPWPVWGGERDGANDLHVAADGSVYVTGEARLASGVSAAMTVKFSRSGTKLWSRTYVGVAGLGAAAYAMAPRPGGGVYVCGSVLTDADGSDGFVIGYPSTGGPRTLFGLDSGAGAISDEAFYDLTVTSASPRRVVAVGASATAGDSDARATVYDLAGAIVDAATRPGIWNDSYVAVAADCLGGYYVTGTEHVSADDARILTWRRSTLPGGGGWSSVVDVPAASASTGPRAIAVRGTTAWVVGTWSSAGSADMDQVVLGYVY